MFCAVKNHETESNSYRYGGVIYMYKHHRISYMLMISKLCDKCINSVFRLLCTAVCIPFRCLNK